MARLSILLFLATTVLAVCALISCLSAEEDQVRGLPRVVWVPLILFVPLVGSVAWFLAGRPVAVAGRRERPRPVAPDDDPEFLKSIDERSRREDAELFRRWEQDLRRREDDLRRREDDPREDDRPEV
ncbi:PLD nuclease N-terminal domain-containing protein [Micromonospora sp. KC723]|uniref:PLD nuclease N-terminal domain-containing protein n=1 Tax=Micromonospora sp. KC723 TaxID=2530381 RepID=UPI0010445CA6|nr:PLD nuclease N-terminal domain-containing protein [Micromonospora sp. KC723]TDB77330.1 PLDc_N domain-containing protein [Micromonospora sp. KC723]